MIVVACSNKPEESRLPTIKKMVGRNTEVKIDIYAKKACENTTPTIEMVKSIVEEMKISYRLNIIFLASHSRANELKIIGSPTVRVNGIDIDPKANQVKKYGVI
jgi:hypothetical protein